MFHGVHHGDGMWTWNGDVERPTIERSVLVCYYVISKEGYDMIERGEKPPAGQKYPGRAMVCHSYVRDGNIEFLGDCTHRLAGKTVPLPPVD